MNVKIIVIDAGISKELQPLSSSEIILYINYKFLQIEEYINEYQVNVNNTWLGFNNFQRYQTKPFFLNSNIIEKVLDHYLNNKLAKRKSLWVTE